MKLNFLKNWNLNILVTNNKLDILGGSETFSYTIIEELVRLGHEVEYFTFKTGFVSDKIEKDLKVNFMKKTKYDLILANHNTTVDKIHKKGFTIQTCHGIFPKVEQPSPKANAYVSISQEVQDHLARLGYPSILIHNSINIDRFKLKNKLNNKLNTILSLCHSKNANNFVKQVCEEMEINFLQAYKYENPIWNVEDLINKVDLVVGLGRSAYEAMSCGRPVVIYDDRRYFSSCGDGYVKDILGLSLKNNCSGRYTNQKFDKNSFKLELRKYNPNDSAYFRRFAEKELDVKNNIIKYLNYHQFSIKKKAEDLRFKKIKIIKAFLGNKNFNRLANMLKYNFK